MLFTQAHTETVNMLVSEKTSLQTQLNHLQKELSDRTSKLMYTPLYDTEVINQV